MRVVIDGQEIDLGTTEAAPTLSIIDYSRRETDDFGVTRVVERGFARRMSVRLALPLANVDSLQRRLASVRAKPALWIADDRFASLSIEGFYKDFALDFSVPPTSFCTLTIEGLAEFVPVTDTGVDPAAKGSVSTLKLLQPVAVTGAALVSTNVAEADYPEWSSLATYASGARVIRASTHSVYESAAEANIGNDPDGLAGKWIYVGPTNRWAMFDQAVGTATQRAGSIAVTILPLASINAVALLDVIGASVRVQATGYDRTAVLASSPGLAMFPDLPSGNGSVTITVTGTGDVSIGTLLLGTLKGIGVTEASPSAAITDFSRKVTDDFGDVTVVERAWVKRMSVRSLINTAALDSVVSRVAAVRATPSLWIGEDGRESLTIYGFFKDFTVEVGESVSTVSLSVEGLSTAARISPIIGTPGTDGAPGAPGIDGTTLYTWIAYADNITGTARFTTGFPDGRAYIGIAANQITEAESQNPADYTWSQYKGPANFGLVAANVNTIVGPNYFEKVAGTDNTWGTGAYSAETFAGAAQLGFTSPQTNKGIFVGLNSDPTTNASYETIDYAFYLRSDGQLATRISGDSEIIHGPYSNALPMQIIYDGRFVRWYHGGDLLRAVAASPDQKFYFDSSIADVGGRIENVTWAAAGRAGDDGSDGAPGTPGVNGITLYTHIAYADSDNGTVNFTTGAPGGRTFVGIAPNKPSAAESANPADYSWSQYKGPANFGLVNFNGNTIVGPNFIQKIGGGGGWDSSAYSSENYRGACATSFTVPSNSYSVMAGLNKDPTTDADYFSLDFAFYVEGGSGTIYIYESGTGIATGWTHVPGTVFQIVYDGKTVTYSYGTTSLSRVVTVAADLRFYFDTSLATGAGARIENITWSAAGRAGRDGTDGLPGQPGANGQTFYTWIAYADHPQGQANFTTGAPGGRAYIGRADNKITPNESFDPAEYTWSQYTGPPNFGLVAGPNMVVAGARVLKTGGFYDWNAQVYSSESFKGGAFVSWRPEMKDQMMVGLNSDPLTNASYDTIDVALYTHSSGWDCRINGAVVYTHPADWVLGDTFAIHYNGREYIFLKNGVAHHVASAGAGITYWLDSSFTQQGLNATILSWAAAGGVGDQGPQGPQGPQGIPGNPGNSAVGYLQDAYPGAGAYYGILWYRPSYRDWYRWDGANWQKMLGDLSAMNAILDSAYIGDGVIINAKIANLTVDYAKIANLTIGTEKMISTAVRKRWAMSLGGDILNQVGIPTDHFMHQVISKDLSGSAIDGTGVMVFQAQGNSGDLKGNMHVYRDGLQVYAIPVAIAGGGSQLFITMPITFTDNGVPAGDHAYWCSFTRSDGSAFAIYIKAATYLRLEEIKL